MVNKIIGEKTFAIGSENYTIRPDFKTIAAIESATGKTLRELLEDVQGLSVVNVTAILFHAAVANGAKKLRVEDVGAAVVESGQMDDQPLQVVAMEFLVEYLPKTKGNDEGNQPARA